VEGLVHVSSLKDDMVSSATTGAVWSQNRAAYRLGDRVAVQVKSVDYRQQIDLVTNGERQTNSEDPQVNLSIDNELSPDPELYPDEE